MNIQKTPPISFGSIAGKILERELKHSEKDYNSGKFPGKKEALQELDKSIDRFVKFDTKIMDREDVFILGEARDSLWEMLDRNIRGVIDSGKNNKMIFEILNKISKKEEDYYQTHRIPLDEGNKGFENAEKKSIADKIRERELKHIR